MWLCLISFDCIYMIMFDGWIPFVALLLTSIRSRINKHSSILLYVVNIVLLDMCLYVFEIMLIYGKVFFM